MARGTEGVSGGRQGSIPPYVAYSTFRNFLDGIRKKPPTRVDKSLMASMSGTIRSQLMGALRYLDLVSPGGVPTESLRRLLRAETSDRPKVLREILTVRYSFLLGEIDVQRTTTNEIQKKLKETGASGDTVRKTLAFFLAACEDAGIQVSPYIKPYQGAGRLRRASSLLRATIGRAFHRTQISDEELDGQGERSFSGLQESLISKFPDFDPAWPDDVKGKWLDDFRELWKSAGGKTRNR